MIDILIQIMLFFVLWVVVGIATLAAGFGDAALASAVGVVIIVVVFVGHQAIWETLTAGRTPGKYAVGLRVVRDDGGPVQFRHALVRALIGAAVEWPGLLMPVVTWVAAIGTMVVNPQGKRLGDLAAGTLVIHERSPATWGWIPATPPPLAAWASTLDLTGLDDELALAVRHFLSRSRQLKEPFRTRLGMVLATEVMAKTTPPPPPQTPGWAYLAAVLGERHRRSAARLAAARATHASLWPELFPTLPPMPHTFTAPAPWPTAPVTAPPAPAALPAPPVRPATPVVPPQRLI
ncbi:MAG: RDD family protein [Catenulispora sp.]|nr:RDD family protein [Catenulispora sp.]